MRSAQDNRDTNKMKITTNNEAERDHLLENGFSLDGIKYRGEEYRLQREPIKFYKCQKFDHTTKECKDIRDTCRKSCGEGQETIECTEIGRNCANCEGSHPNT